MSFAHRAMLSAQGWRKSSRMIRRTYTEIMAENLIEIA